MKSVLKKVCAIILIAILFCYFFGETDEQYHRKFALLTIGMTKEEVVKVVGEPLSKNDGDDYWHYQVSKHPYPGAILLFTDGRLVQVHQPKKP